MVNIMTPTTTVATARARVWLKAREPGLRRPEMALRRNRPIATTTVMMMPTIKPILAARLVISHDFFNCAHMLTPPECAVL